MAIDLYAVRRVLCGSTSFLIDEARSHGGSLAFKGWALTGAEAAENFCFTVNGRPAERQRLGLASPSLERVFPFFSGSSSSGFDFEMDVRQSDLERGFVEVSLCDGVFLEPTNSWHTAYMPLSMDGFRIPDEAQLQRTQGNVSASRYVIYGFSTASRLKRILRTYFQLGLADVPRILDWGVGCGRVAQHMAEDGVQLIGCDIDRLNVQWCASNLAGEFFCNDLIPPLPVASGSIDLCYGISVFTHLTAEAALAWRDELARVVRPKGIVIVTIHGTTGIGRILDDGKFLSLARDGFDDSDPDPRLDEHLIDRNYYRATYQSPRSIREFFSEGFDVVDMLSGANALLQDFVVLQRRQG